MSAFTPGPWTMNKANKTPMVGLDVQDGGDLLPIANTVHGYSVKQAKANARLIAAAPDLLRELQSLRYLVLDSRSFAHPEKAERLRAADAAIAKAEGRP